ncbi:hypothetical protein E4H04_13045 [Candidatus Bathyarchaeota archaeon]|nr:MAG: hypothetical protein E4H04_13045 [Candidatus Bathyarchaeota archaeon]
MPSDWFDDGTTFSWASLVSGGSDKQFVRTGQTGTSPIDGTRTTYSATFSVSLLAYTGATSGQYSDPVTVSARLTSDGSGVSGVTITFTIGTQSTTAETGSSGIASTTITLKQEEGDYTVTASCAGADSTTLTALDDFTINKETAYVEYTGDAGMVTVAAERDTTRTVRVAAQVTQDDDGFDGDLTLMTLKFTIDGYDSGAHHYSDTVSGTPVNSAGQAVAFIDVPIGAYIITVEIEDNSYWTYAEDENTIAICDFNPDGYVTGGGWIPSEDSINGKINFAFVVKYDKKGNSKGSFVAILKSTDGFNYRIKSTSWAQNKADLTFGNTEKDGSGLPTACLRFGGIVQIIDRATGEGTSWGGCQFIIDMTDGDYRLSQNGELDSIAITVVDNAGIVALQWGSNIHQIVIGGGNIVVAVSGNEKK